MSLRQRKAYTAMAIFLAFSFTQVYVQTGFAKPAGSGSVPMPQQFIARLTTRGGSVTVNGATAGSGATVLTGATLETPDQVSATIDLGPLGTVELPPGAKIQLDFDDSGNVHVKVLKGCVTMKKKGKGIGDISSPDGTPQQVTNGKAGGFCFINGQLTPSNAAASGGGGGGAAGAGISTAVKVAIIAGAAGGTIAIVAGTRGTNPSP